MASQAEAQGFDGKEWWIDSTLAYIIKGALKR
jgi:hypothetical protein